MTGKNGATPKRFLKKDEILQVADIRKEELFVPEWDAWVMVYGLTGQERDTFEESNIVRNGADRTFNFLNMRARLCAIAIRDENGKRLFTDDEARELGKKSASALDRIMEVAQRLSAIRAEDIEALTKNSSSDQTEGLPSA